MKTIADRELRALAPIERVALLIDAIARDDDRERKRLWGTSSRVVVQTTDPETVDLFNRVRWTIAIVTVELTGPLACFDLFASLRRPLQHDDDGGLLGIVEDRVLSGYLIAHFHAIRGDEHRDDDDRLISEATTAANDAVSFLHDALDALAQYEANRVATVMRAFDIWSDASGLDAAALLAALAPWIPEELERYALLLEGAEVDTLAAQELAAQLQSNSAHTN
jgi:hypothetical protein